MEKYKTIHENKILINPPKKMKTIRRLLGLYNEAELIAFGNTMYNKEKTNANGVTHADVSNFKWLLKLDK